uniref:tetratricopeptide repeat protein n=1 Tax=Thaumasiovibrio occultus TaxID=1891184 RepID=UPI000B35DADB|nr:tetratricopeptide repeat protein [Thaumasiovibrio occultus]
MKILWATVLIVVPLVGSICLVAHLSRVKRQQLEAKQKKEREYQQALERAKRSEHEERLQRARGGHIPTMLSLAKECEPMRLGEAIKWYQLAAEAGNSMAQRALCRLCKQDVNDPQGEARSVYWEAVVGHNEKDIAQTHRLALCLYEGFGVEQDLDQAFDYMTQAAEQQNVESQVRLGEWYKESDPERALMWWQRAAINHHVGAQLSTALCYQAGIGTEKNRHRAVYWLERAAEQQDATAQFLAGKMHLGRSEDDAIVAYTWFSIAAANGHAQAQDYRKDVLPEIPSDFLYQAQGVARQVHKIIKNMGEDEDPGSAISLLDKVYSRSGYFPSAKQLAQLAAYDMDHFDAGSTESDNPVEQAFSEHENQWQPQGMDGNYTDYSAPLSFDKF